MPTPTTSENAPPVGVHLNRTTLRRTMTSRTRTHALLALPATAAVLALLVGCSDDAAQTAPEVTETQAASGDQQSGEMPGGGGVTGEIAAVSDLLMQVQGDDGQTAVTWDDSTAITQTVSGTLADVTAGVCVVAITSGDDTDAAATSIAISTATDGECTTGVGGGSGFGGGDGGGNGEQPSGMPSGGTGEDGEQSSDMPSDMPSGASGGGGFGGVTSGLVTAVDGSTITVDATDQDGTTTSSTVTVDDSTTYSTTVTADSSAITVGRCVTAQGESDDTGQVAATSLTLSDAGDDGCSTGFGGGMGGAGGGQQGEDDGDA